MYADLPCLANIVVHAIALYLLLSPLCCRKQKEAKLEGSSSSLQALDGAGDLLHTHIPPLPALEKGLGYLQVWSTSEIFSSYACSIKVLTCTG